MHILPNFKSFSHCKLFQKCFEYGENSIFPQVSPWESQINSDSISQAYFVLSWHLQQEFKAQSSRVVKRNWTRGSWSAWRLMTLWSLIHIPFPKPLQWALPLLDKTQEQGKRSKTWILTLKPAAVTGDTPSPFSKCIWSWTNWFYLLSNPPNVMELGQSLGQPPQNQILEILWLGRDFQCQSSFRRVWHQHKPVSRCPKKPESISQAGPTSLAGTCNQKMTS